MNSNAISPTKNVAILGLSGSAVLIPQLAIKEGRTKSVMSVFPETQQGEISMKIIILGSLALALGIAATAEAQSVSPAQFVAKAGASDKFEIDSAKLEAGSSNPDLVKFANQMIVDHTKSTMMIKRAAAADKLAPKPPMLNAEQMKNLAALRSASGAARDTLYISQQKVAHSEALDLMQTYAANGTAANLKDAAGQIVPVVQMHKDMIDKM